MKSTKSKLSGFHSFFNSYRLINIQEIAADDGGGLLGHLQVKQANDVYGSDIPFLQLFVKPETETRFRVHITDAENQRWEVPYDLLPREQPPPPSGKKKKNNVKPNDVVEGNYTTTTYGELIFSYTPDPFSFAVTRKSTGERIFDTTGPGPMVFKDQYLEISTKLPAEGSSLYGLGEHDQAGGGFRLAPRSDRPYTQYTTDLPADSLDAALYGSHPFYMEVRSPNGSAHGVLLLNSNGMNVFYNGDSLTYKVIGGVFDFYFFAGPSPLGVVDQYTLLVGRPAPMPYWAFGFHQSKWGYENISTLETVIDNYKNANIPLDVIWSDDDYMDSHRDFTVSPTNYPLHHLRLFLDKIHNFRIKYVVFTNIGINVDSDYPVYQRATADDVFIKYDDQPYLGKLWVGAVHFPDFLNPTTVSWWADEIRRFHDTVPVDGLWLDMNEPSNFCSGLCTFPLEEECPLWECCLSCEEITGTKWDDPPYKIAADESKRYLLHLQRWGNPVYNRGKVPPGDSGAWWGIESTTVGMPTTLMGNHTVAAGAMHYNGVREYDTHSLYSLAHVVAGYKALLHMKGKRPFLLSRSTYVGIGKYAAHWTGDNTGDWNNLKYSIPTMLNFGIFGVPMVGSDKCGHYPPAGSSPVEEELCNRWIRLGAFYPFSRDHANLKSPRQELYVWESVAESARTALAMRYKLLPFLYTLNYEAHTTGAPIARPLFFSFPNYTQCYATSSQFMLGSSLMVSPVLEKGGFQVTALFPPGTWYC